MKIFVLIPAGGSGVRFGGDVKKQFLALGGVSLLERTVHVFSTLPEISGIVVALPENELEKNRALFSDPKVYLTAGGGCRATSVRNAFRALKDVSDDDVILVHDAVRPLVSADLIRRVAACADQNGTALPVLKVADTIKSVRDGLVKGTVDREYLGAAQTPQGARYGIFKEAYDAVGDSLAALTDESMLWEAAGFPVHTVDGDRLNIKVTTPEDLKMAEMILGWAEKL